MQVHHPFSLKRNKENKGDFTRMISKDKIHFSLCEIEEEEGYKGREESIKRRMERIIRIPETVKREEKQQKQ